MQSQSQKTSPFTGGGDAAPSKEDEMIPYMITIKIMHFGGVGGQFLPVQWLGLRVLTAEGPGSVPGPGN